MLSAHARPPAGEPDRPAPVHVAFVDWVPGLCSLLGMLVINVIDKDRVRGEDVGYGDAGAVWRARAVLFVGFALMAGGLAGSVVRRFVCFLAAFVWGYVRFVWCADGVWFWFWFWRLAVAWRQTVLVLKYVLHAYPEEFLYYGYANVSQNVAFMLSAIVLWIAQSAPSEYEYSLSI